MDGQRFDAWTRMLARGMPRRRALQAITGMALAGIGLASRSAHDAEAAPCIDYGFACSPGQCCPGYVCRAGFGNSICGYCIDKDALCSYPAECCSGGCSAKWWTLFIFTTCDASPQIKKSKSKIKGKSKGKKKGKKHPPGDHTDDGGCCGH